MDRRTKNRPTETPSRLADKGTRVVWCFSSAPFQPVLTVSGTHWLETVCLSANMFRSSWGFPPPLLILLPQLSNFPLLTPLEEKELVFLKSGPTVDQRKSGLCSIAAPPLEGFFICVPPDGSGHDVVTPSSVFPKRSYKWSFWTARKVCSALDH